MDDLNNIGEGSQQSNNGTIEQSPSPSSLAPNGLTPNPSFTYYAQCGDQGSLPLPDGGTLCSAGCGPTTVAMISSSYMDKNTIRKLSLAFINQMIISLEMTVPVILMLMNF